MNIKETSCKNTKTKFSLKVDCWIALVYGNPSLEVNAQSVTC